jgi:hypothetical protein
MAPAADPHPAEASRPDMAAFSDALRAWLTHRRALAVAGGPATPALWTAASLVDYVAWTLARHQLLADLLDPAVAVLRAVGDAMAVLRTHPDAPTAMTLRDIAVQAADRLAADVAAQRQQAAALAVAFDRFCRAVWHVPATTAWAAWMPEAPVEPVAPRAADSALVAAYLAALTAAWTDEGDEADGRA